MLKIPRFSMPWSVSVIMGLSSMKTALLLEVGSALEHLLVVVKGEPRLRRCDDEF